MTLTTTACSFEVNPYCATFYNNGTIAYNSPGGDALDYVCLRCDTDGTNRCYCSCSGNGGINYNCVTQTSGSGGCDGTGCSSDCYNACCTYAECSGGR